MDFKRLKARQSATPSYFGGKQNLTSWIAGNLSKHVPMDRWPKMTFIDAFLGGGAISVFAKHAGFQQVLSNDCSERANAIGRAFLLNQRHILSQVDLLWMNQPLPEGMVGPITLHYCPSVFSTRHAQALDRWIYWAGQLKDPIRRSLCQMVIWHTLTSFLCFPTSMGTSNRPYAEALDGVRSWDQIKEKRFQDQSIQRLLKPTLEILKTKCHVVNQGVFSGSPVSLFQKDALTFLPSVNGDMVYLDPPYAGTLRYDQGFALVDELLFSNQPTTGLTNFSSSVEALSALLDSIQHIPTWVLSYGNKEIDLNGLVAVVQKHAKNRQVTGYAKAYAHMPHVAKRQDNQELLIIASPKL